MRLVTRPWPNASTKIDKERGTRGNRLFYFAAAPRPIRADPEALESGRLEQTPKGSWARVIVEKPFGTDLASARELNRIVRNSFTEEQTYRIDHFLGKETAQNILVLRFANAIFEPLWNTRYIDHVQITAAETLGVEDRAGYYEGAGALRDMVQNHLLQLLCLVAMEPPTDLSADSIRDEKVKVVRSLRRMVAQRKSRPMSCAGNTRKGAINGKPVAGYREEENVNPESTDRNFRRACVCSSTTGAGPTCRFTCASESGFRNRRPKFPSISKKRRRFCLTKNHARQNVLVIRIQPDEGISLRMQAKMPGTSFRIEPVKMDFHYGTSFGKPSPEAYERLLLDAMSGDATLFARRDEVEEAWAFIDHDRRSVAREKDAARAVLLSGRLVGTGGSGRIARPRRPRMATRLVSDA